jgi:hypothetical protein
MRRRGIEVGIAWFGGVMLATLDTAHLLGFVSELVPRQYAFLVPIATVAFFTVALYLSHAKHPHLILDGTFAPQGTPDHAQSGLFVSNVGDAVAINVMLEPLGGKPFGVSFDPVPFVNAGGDRKAVTMRYGSDVRDMFGVGTMLSMRNVVSRDPEDVSSHPIRFTYEAQGRTVANDEYELAFIVGPNGVTIANRYVVRRRRKTRLTIRERLGALLVRLAARILLQPPKVE